VRKLAMRKFLRLITQLSEDIHTRYGGVFICVKNYTTCFEQWVEVYEMITIEAKVRYLKVTWEIVGIYRTPHEDMQVLEKLEYRTGYMGSFTKPSIIGGELNLH
jgi:hypothetical protein